MAPVQAALFLSEEVFALCNSNQSPPVFAPTRRKRALAIGWSTRVVTAPRGARHDDVAADWLVALTCKKASPSRVIGGRVLRTRVSGRGGTERALGVRLECRARLPGPVGARAVPAPSERPLCRAGMLEGRSRAHRGRLLAHSVQRSAWPSRSRGALRDRGGQPRGLPLRRGSSLAVPGARRARLGLTRNAASRLALARAALRPAELRHVSARTTPGKLRT